MSSPTAADRASKPIAGAWQSVALQRSAQAAWDRDADAVRTSERAAARTRARDAKHERADRRQVARGAVDRSRTSTKTPSLAALARRAWFASWSPDRTRAQIAETRAILVESLTRLRARDRSPARDLAELRRCVRALNRLDARDPDLITTIEAEELHAALVELATACGLDDTVAADAIDALRSW